MKRFALAGIGLLLCLNLTPAAEVRPEQAAVEYLQGLQAADGGFLPAAPTAGAAEPRSSLRATSAALRALKYNGGAPKNRDACVVFVKKCFDRTTGGFADQPGGTPDVVSTAIGILAVMELKLSEESYSGAVTRYLGEHARTFDEIRIAVAGMEALGRQPKQAAAWLDLVAKMRNEDGTYGKDDGMARDTGSAVVVVLRLKGTVANEAAVLKALKAGQRKDGAFGKGGASGSDLETSYRVLRGFHMLKARPDDVKALQAFIARCHNSDGGWGVAPGQPSSVSGTYYASSIQHWLEEK